MSREQEERALRLARLRQEIQAGLNSGSPVEVGDLDSFLAKCADEASKELREQT